MSGHHPNKRRFYICFAVVLISLLSGCRNNPTVWKMDVRSPDGAWIATARTDQWGGFGSAWVETVVSIRKMDGTVNRGAPFDILSYPGGGTIPRTYVLSDENADQNLQIRWTSARHLGVTHHTVIEPDLMVVRFSDVDISYDIKRQIGPSGRTGS